MKWLVTSCYSNIHCLPLSATVVHWSLQSALALLIHGLLLHTSGTLLMHRFSLTFYLLRHLYLGLKNRRAVKSIFARRAHPRKGNIGAPIKELYNQEARALPGRSRNLHLFSSILDLTISISQSWIAEILSHPTCRALPPICHMPNVVLTGIFEAILEENPRYALHYQHSPAPASAG